MDGAPLDPFKVARLPSSFYYVKNFITSEEEQRLMQKIQAGRWIQLAHRRLQVYPAQLTAKNVLLADKPLPDFLSSTLSTRFEHLEVFKGSTHGGMNHILINEYEPGQGIMPHEDGDAYAPITATVSLGGHTVLNIYGKTATGERREAPTYRILQEGCSLLVTRGEAYSQYLHSIEEVTVDTSLCQETVSNWNQLANPHAFQTGQRERSLRISLTCRDVVKVSKLGGRLLGKR